GIAVAVQGTVGAIGYVEIAPVATQGLHYASLKAIRGKTFQQPLIATPNGVGANVDLSRAQLPAGSPLGTGAQTSASSADAVSPANVVGGSAYPIQGLILVLAQPLATVPNAISRATLDQRQTLLDYLMYALSPDVQGALSGQLYAPLPSSWRA